MKVRALNDSVQVVLSEAVDRDAVIQIHDANGVIAEYPISEIKFERGDSLLAPHDPMVQGESKLILKVQI